MNNFNSQYINMLNDDERRASSNEERHTNDKVARQGEQKVQETEKTVISLFKFRYRDR
jgi:hypothetical protein